jgi:glucose/arabinose dehydrogenase
MRRLIVLAVALAGCGNGGETVPGAETVTGGETVMQTEPPTPAPAGLDFGRVETVASGLEVPWELAFVGERAILVTERPGRVRVVEDGRLREKPVATIDVRAEGEGGLLGIAVREGFAFVYYTAGGGNRVSRFPLRDDLSFGEEEVLIDGIPAAAFHDGGRIAFGPGGMLYVTTGDAGDPESAADRGSLGGKILRLDPEGGAPELWSWGHRNPQGLAWSDDGTMYASEHGPSGEFGLCCHDEVNEIEQDLYFGWPYRAGFESAAGGDPPAPPIEPLASSGEDTWAPAGLAWHDGTLYLATLAGQRLLAVSPDGAVETALDGYGRLRAAAIGPDGCLYLTTSNRDGRGDPASEDDRILRVCPG